MIHAFLLLAGVFMIIWGVVICVLLISMSIKVGKAVWLVTVPGVLIVAILALDFGCHILHLPHHILPYQKQLVNGIRWTLRLAAIPLLAAKLCEMWGKRRARDAQSRKINL